MRFPGLAILLAAAAAGICAGQSDSTNTGSDAQIVPRARPAEASANTQPRANIRVDTDVVLVPISVVDPLNHFVEGLGQNVFEVYEDKVRQKIVSFGSEDAPLSIGIVFDTSGSMASKIQHSKLSVAGFFKTANPEDEAFLVEFRDRPWLSVPFTRNLEEIQNRLVAAQPKGDTALLDSVYLALANMKKARNARKALILITDGGDNNSRYTQGEILDMVKEADVQIYAIGVNRVGRSQEELMGPELLHNLVGPTGGRYFIIGNDGEIPEITEKIGVALRNQYVVGYTPENGERDGKYRKITVKLNQPSGFPRLHAYWRSGYYAPTQ